MCVPEVTAADRLAKTRYPVATGPVAPRLLACPGGSAFDPETKTCQFYEV